MHSMDPTHASSGGDCVTVGVPVRLSVTATVAVLSVSVADGVTVSPAVPESVAEWEAVGLCVRV